MNGHSIFSRLIILLLCVTSLSVSCTRQKANTNNFATYANDKRGYEIQYPKDWETNVDVKGFDLFVMAPKNEEGRSFANVSIISGELPASVDLDVYYSENMKHLEKSTKIDMKDKGETEINGKKSKWVRYMRDDKKIEIIHYFLVDNGVAYLITCGSAEEAYDKFAGTCESIVHSFKLKNAH